MKNELLEETFKILKERRSPRRRNQDDSDELDVYDIYGIERSTQETESPTITPPAPTPTNTPTATQPPTNTPTATPTMPDFSQEFRDEMKRQAREIESQGTEIKKFKEGGFVKGWLNYTMGEIGSALDKLDQETVVPFVNSIPKSPKLDKVVKSYTKASSDYEKSLDNLKPLPRPANVTDAPKIMKQPKLRKRVNTKKFY